MNFINITAVTLPRHNQQELYYIKSKNDFFLNFLDAEDEETIIARIRDHFGRILATKL